MITNNKYIRGDIGVFNDKVSSSINIEDYNGEKANKYLITKEYLNKQLNGSGIPSIINQIILKEDIKDFRLELDNRFIWDVYIICQEIDYNDYFSYEVESEEQRIYGVNNYLMKLKETYNGSKYIYTIDTNKKYNLKNNTFYIGVSPGQPEDLLICVNSKYIIPVIPYYKVITSINDYNDDVRDITDNNNNKVGELTNRHYIDYYNYIKTKKILINSVFKINLNSNITSNENYGCILETLNNFYNIYDKSNNNIDINFLKFVFLFDWNELFYFVDLNNLNNYKYFIKISSFFVEEPTVDYYLLLQNLQLTNNKMINITLNATCYDGTYNDIYDYSDSGKKLIVSNEPIINDYDNIHFIIKGTSLNNISTNISNTEEEHEFILKKIIIQDHIMFKDDHTEGIPSLSSEFLGIYIRSDDYLDDNSSYRYILMEKYEDNEKIIAFNKTNINYTNYEMVLYHEPTNIFFVPISYISKIQPTGSSEAYILTLCYMPLKHLNYVQNGLEIKNIVINSFGNNISKAMFLNKFTISSLVSNTDNSSNQYINISNIPQTYIKNNYLLSNWTTDEDYFNIQTEYDIKVMYHTGGSPSPGPSPLID